MILTKLLSKKERKVIDEKLEQIAQKYQIIGQIEVNKESDPYPGAVLRVAIYLSLVLSLVAIYLIELEFNFLSALIPFLFIFISLPFIRSFNLKSYALSEEEMKREVSEKAIESFYLHSLRHPDSQGTFLLYFSQLESRFEFIFSENITINIKDSHKEEMSLIFKTHFKKREYALGFLNVIDLIYQLENNQNALENKETISSEQDKSL